MKIRSIFIEGFGKFRNYRLDFNDGMNFIYGPNEAGKSTIMAFIEMMFYGKMANEKSADIGKSFRKKYAPWDGNKMGGELEFTANGHNYRIQKTFKKTIKTDEVKLFDADTGEEILLGKDEEIGLHFLGIDVSSFEKSAYISGFGGFMDDGQTNEDLAVRLSNIITTMDEDVSATEVLDRIEEAKYLLKSKRGDKGEIIVLNEEYDRLCAKLADTKELMKSQVELKKTKDQINEEIIRCTNRRDAIRLKLRAQEIEAAKEKNEEAKAEINRTLAQARMMSEEYEDLLLQKKEIEECGVTYDQIPSFVESSHLLKLAITNHQNQVAEAESRLRSITKEKPAASNRHTNWKGFLVASIVAFLATAVLGAMGYLSKMRAVLPENPVDTAVKVNSQYRIFLILAVVFAVVCVCTFALFIQMKKQDALFVKQDIEREAAYREQLRIAQDSYDNAYANLGRAVSEYEQRTGRTDLDELRSRYAQINELEASVKAKISVWGMNYADFRENMADRIASEEAKLVALSEATEETEKYTGEGNLGEPPTSKEEGALGELPTSMEESDFEELPMSIEECDNKIAELYNDLHEVAGRMRTPEYDLDYLSARIAEVKEELEEKKSRYEALETAYANVQATMNEINRNFCPKLSERTASIFAKLTGGEYDGVMVDKEYAIQVKKEDSTYHEWKFLSSGTTDQAYLALRLALADLITQGSESLPILLDDVLLQYDDTRTGYALDYLMERAKESQVIYFTCKKNLVAEEMREI